MPQGDLIDLLIDHDWLLASSGLLLLALLRFGFYQHRARRLMTRFPSLMALADLVLLPGAALVVGSSLRVGAEMLNLGLAAQPLRGFAVLLFYTALCWALVQVLDVWLFRQGQTSDRRDRVPGLLRALAYASGLLVGIALTLWHQGYAITGVWLSTGVAAALVGFALQRPLGDLFSGIALGIERPFKIGDWIELPEGTVGRVVDINWRATRLCGWDNASHIIPNSLLASQAIKNYEGGRRQYAPWYLVRVPAEVDPRFATALLLEAAMRCPHVLKRPLPVARLADATRQPYSYMIWVHYDNYPAMFRGREELFREIHYVFLNAGIHISPKVAEWRTRRADANARERPSIIQSLRALDLAHDWNDEEIERIAAVSNYLDVDAGAVLLHEGAVAEAFDIVVHGLVEASITLPNGSREVTELLGPGDYYGILSMATAEPSFLEYTARSDVVVIRIAFDCLRDVLALHPDRAAALAATVKRRFDAAERARTASHRDVPKRGFREIRRLLDELIRKH